MLVLSRKRGESLIIGEDIKVAVVDICGTHCKIGIDAPVSVNIRREEIPKEDVDEDHGV